MTDGSTKDKYARVFLTDSGHYLLPTDDPDAQVAEEESSADTEEDSRTTESVREEDGWTVEHIDKVIRISQRPIGRTPRSNPATYTGAIP